LEPRKLDAVLRALRPRHARLDGREVEVERRAVVDLARARDAEEALRLVVGAEHLDLPLVAPRRQQVLAALLVHGEVAHRRAVLGRHVADGRAVRDGDAGRALAVELDELADDLRLPQHLRHAQHEVGRRHAFPQTARQVHADHVGRQDVDGLAEHRGLGLDAADAPADDAEPVNHRRVRVRADERVGVVNAVSLHHAAREVFEVDLVDDAYAGRDDVEALERLHAPLEELVARAVAAELGLHVEPQRVRA
jgi:hypothetical protein